MPGAELRAQFRPDINRPATTAEVIAGNILIGGVVSAARALFTDADPLHAFAIGAFGGAVHVAGKNLAVEPGLANGLAGLVLAGAGTSIIANAGRGVSPWHELSVPFASLRLRVTPREARKVSVVINAFESGVILHEYLREGLQLDLARSFATGTVLFIARGKRIVRSDGDTPSGFAVVPVAVIGGDARDTARVIRHEVVHVHQQWFIQETLGRPIEEFARASWRPARFIPSWMELGLFGPALMLLENWATNSRGGLRLMEAEAELLERR